MRRRGDILDGLLCQGGAPRLWGGGTDESRRRIIEVMVSDSDHVYVERKRPTATVWRGKHGEAGWGALVTCANKGVRRIESLRGLAGGG
jgi:hypothetical protein